MYSNLAKAFRNSSESGKISWNKSSIADASEDLSPNRSDFDLS